MKKYICAIALAFALVSCGQQNPYIETQNVASDYKVVPLPQKMETQNGRFWLNEKTKIYFDNELQKEAEFLKEYIKLQTGIEVALGKDAKFDKGIYLHLDANVSSAEGYKIDGNADLIVVSANKAQGVFYGLQTLRQLITEVNTENNELHFVIPAAKIEDAPRFAYRGMHLDVGRHMFSMDFIKKYIDLLALHKMNRFHWHLTEDQGWRLEIKKYPKLTEVGAWREQTAIGKNFPHAYEGATFKGDGKRYGGFYTQEEAREIVKYAAERHIIVIPEIDMPGHMLAALAAYPELGNGTGPYKVAEYWGVFDQVLAPKEETFQFLEDVLTEVMDIFPSEYIHIGGDEAPKKEWKESAQAQEVIKQLGLKDDTEPNPMDGKKHTKEEKLQSYFISRVEKFLNGKGRQIIGWDEILEGGLAPNATVMSWRGVEGGIAAAKAGHKAIMTPGGYCYFDHYQDKVDAETKQPYLSICCLTTVEKTYSYDPVPAEFIPEQAKLIWGVQANLWTEYIHTPEQAEYMVAPRMTALSEVQWTPVAQKNYEQFKERIPSIRNILDIMKVNYAKHMFNEKK
ncbi:beta-N-acetylhexosaminidase [Capnocytophaga sp.]|uniref:beta-N-acetylhexosaminidase n=1 Tax=Capnocytophaga sp. TaxID=44737 RepID=UPI0026DBF11B|nr:beta-N-acetylhexosaminidase [Capnocytophaga sp.]MDO5106477.1 beta-N-acetylhexosaminidase [Capnocytophaga sp.]